jgi:hypothetical protein
VQPEDGLWRNSPDSRKRKKKGWYAILPASYRVFLRSTILEQELQMNPGRYELAVDLPLDRR